MKITITNQNVDKLEEYLKDKHYIGLEWYRSNGNHERTTLLYSDKGYVGFDVQHAIKSCWGKPTKLDYLTYVLNDCNTKNVIVLFDNYRELFNWLAEAR